jgi:hypothetical protein
LGLKSAALAADGLLGAKKVTQKTVGEGGWKNFGFRMKTNYQPY